MRRSFSRVIILNDWEDGRHRRVFSSCVFEQNHSKLVKHRKNSQSAATLQMKKWQIALEMPLCQQTEQRPSGLCRSFFLQLWRIEESFRIMKSDLDARPVFLQKEETIKGHFLICYLTVLLIRLFQFCELENKYSSSEVLRFMKDFKVVGNGKGYINITIGSSFITALAGRTKLPLDHYTLSERQLKTVLNFKL